MCRSGISRGSADLLVELGHQAELLLALIGVERHRRDDEGFHAGVPERPQPFAGAVLGSRDGGHVDELIRERFHRGGLLAGEIKVLNLARCVLEPIRRDETVVEVLLARAHASYVQGQHRAHGVTCARDVVVDQHVDLWADPEIVERAPRARREPRLPRAAPEAWRRARARRTPAASRPRSRPPARRSWGRARPGRWECFPGPAGW